MTRAAHPHPEAMAIRLCGPACSCGRIAASPGQRIRRHLCEPKYRSAIRRIIDRALYDPAQPPSPEIPPPQNPS